MEFSALELSIFLDGSIEGNPSVKVRKPAKIEEAQEGDICFIGNAKYIKYAYTTAASIIIVNNDMQFDQPILATLIRVKDAYSSVAMLLEKYKIDQKNTGIHQLAFISKTASIGQSVFVDAFTLIGDGCKIGDGAQISANCVLGKNVVIGDYTILFPGVIILDNCIIGNHCILNSNCVIGSEGFGFAPQPDGSFKKVAQTGNVVLEDHVEIGSNTTIDRATMGSTLLKKGVKLDNLIQIAHNVEIGENTVIAAQTGVAGSTKIGKNCIIGGQVGLVGHILIADNTKINAQSGVSKTIVATKTSVTGSPAFAYNDAMRSQVVYKKLPQLYDKILALEKQLKELEATNQ